MVLASDDGGGPGVAVGGSLKLNGGVNLAGEVDRIGELGLKRNLRGLRPRWGFGFASASGSGSGSASGVTSKTENQTGMRITRQQHSPQY